MNLNLARERDYLAICIDENNQVIKSYGDTTKYLLQKHFISDLVELLPKPLVIALNTLSADALKTNQQATVGGIKIKQGNDIIKVNLSVSPLEVKGEQRLLMVTFSEDKTSNLACGQILQLLMKIYI